MIVIVALSETFLAIDGIDGIPEGSMGFVMMMTMIMVVVVMS